MIGSISEKHSMTTQFVLQKSALKLNQTAYTVDKRPSRRAYSKKYNKWRAIPFSKSFKSKFEGEEERGWGKKAGKVIKGNQKCQLLYRKLTLLIAFTKRKSEFVDNLLRPAGMEGKIYPPICGSVHCIVEVFIISGYKRSSWGYNKEIQLLAR